MIYSYEYGYSFMGKSARARLASLGDVGALGGFFDTELSPGRVVLFHIPPPPPESHPLRPLGMDYMVCYVGSVAAATSTYPAGPAPVRYSGTFVQGHLRESDLDMAVLAGQLEVYGASVAQPVNFGTADNPLHLCFDE